MVFKNNNVRMQDEYLYSFSDKNYIEFLWCDKRMKIPSVKL